MSASVLETAVIEAARKVAMDPNSEALDTLSDALKVLDGRIAGRARKLRDADGHIWILRFGNSWSRDGQCGTRTRGQIEATFGPLEEIFDGD
jgi:hypothetical protein